MTPDERRNGYLNEIRAGRSIADRLTWWARIVVGIGALASLVAVVLLVSGLERPDIALELLLLVGLASIVSGVSFFATSQNLRLSAARLEVQIDPLDKP